VAGEDESYARVPGMPRRRDMLLAVLAASLPGGRTQAAVPLTAPSSDHVLALLTDEVDAGRNSVGMIAGLLDRSGRRLIAYGRADDAGSRPLDGDTVFEIGSVTKVFTALLLADMAERGEVALTDPVTKYLPASVRMHELDGRPITLIDLATHTSGLPHRLESPAPADPANPYADFTVDQLYSFLSLYQPRLQPGTHYEYSNFGFGLLGHVLALRGGRTFEDLVVGRICDPLGLDSTRITLTASMQARLAAGHDYDLKPGRSWDLPTLPGAGALRSTTNDMLAFLEACLGRRRSPLAPAMAGLLEVRRPTGIKALDAGEGWLITTHDDDELAWKDGLTNAYASFIGYSTRSGLGMVLMSNAANRADRLNLLGRYLLNPGRRLPAVHRQVSIDPALLEKYVGRYQLTPALVMTVTDAGGRLLVQTTGQRAYDLFPEGEAAFFYRAVDAQLTFEPGPDGDAAALVLYQNGTTKRASRV